jgi:purine-binding chemotaxis protein CheW
VDAVNDIVTVRPEDMQPPPKLGDSAAGFLDGIATIDERMILMICLDRLMDEVIPSCQAA